MPNRKFNHDEHLAIGNEVRQTRNVLHGLTLKIGATVPRSSRLSRAIRRAEHHFNTLRLELENTFARDFPDHEFRGIYFGDHGQAYKENSTHA